MNDIERRLRDLGERTREELRPPPVLGPKAHRSARRRRIGTVLTGILTVIAMVSGGTYAAGMLNDDESSVAPANTPTPDERADAPRCGHPVDFKPTYLPDEWIEVLQSGEGGGGEFRGIVGHYGNDDQAGTTTKAAGGFADLIAEERPYQQGNTEEIRVLDAPATLGDVHEGFSVEFAQHGCDYFLLAFGVAREELRRFAEGLRLPGTYEPAGPSYREHFGAIWPNDSFSEARDTCQEAMRDPQSPWRGTIQAALNFATEVLGWTPAKLIDRDSGPDAHTIEVQRSRPNDPNTPDGRAVLVVVERVMPECWFVTGVQRMPEEAARYQENEGAMLSVQDRDVSMYFADFEDAVTATLEVGYGGESTQHVWTKGDGIAEFKLEFDDPDEPNDTGHFLILLRDETGDVFSAFGSSLPAGSFAAG